MRVLLIGFGNVGRKMAEILTTERERHPGLASLDVTAAGIFTRSHGALAGDVDLGEAVELIHRHGRFPQELAQQNGVRLLHESAVMDGAPLFGMVRASLRGCTIEGVSGILNSTTNFVLNEMERGVSLADAVRTARLEGFAEADPSHDLEGWDAAAKVTVLANALLGARQTPFDVEREGITGVTPARVQQVLRSGKRLKLVCHAERAGGGVRTRVRLEELPPEHPFSTLSGSGSVLRIETDLMGPIIVAQEEPTLYDTAYGVLNDLLTLASLVP